MAKTPYVISLNNPEDSPQKIAEKLNSLPYSLEPHVIKGVVLRDEFDSLQNITKKYINGNKERIDSNDLRWHGGGLGKVSHDDTLIGDGTTANPLSVISSGAVFSLSRGWGGGINPDVTTYNDTEGTVESVETNVGNIMPIAGTIRNLFIDIYDAQIDSGTVVFTLIHNGSSTSVTVGPMDVDSNAIASDVTHSFPVSAGDRISLQSAVTGGTTNQTKFSFSYLLQ